MLQEPAHLTESTDIDTGTLQRSIGYASRVKLLSFCQPASPGQGGGPERDDVAGPATNRAALVLSRLPGINWWRLVYGRARRSAKK